MKYEKEEWDGWGYEYKSQTAVMGLPLLHISFKYDANKMPVAAKGIVSIGQFGIGIINISQFGIGVVSVSQFAIAGYGVAQIGLAYGLVAQIGVYLGQGYGQFVTSLVEFISAVQNFF